MSNLLWCASQSTHFAQLCPSHKLCVSVLMRTLITFLDLEVYVWVQKLNPNYMILFYNQFSHLNFHNLSNGSLIRWFNCDLFSHAKIKDPKFSDKDNPEFRNCTHFIVAY